MSETAAPVSAGATPVASQGSPTQPIIARAGRYYRNTRYIMAVLTVAMGLWFGYDGFVRWPAENKAYAKMDADLQEIQRRGDSITDLMKEQWHNQPHHTDLDVTLQRTLAFSLPPLGILLLIWAK